MITIKKFFTFIFLTIFFTVSYPACADLNRTTKLSIFKLNKNERKEVENTNNDNKNMPLDSINYTNINYNGGKMFVIPNYQLPKTASLCGETIPLNNSFVYERLEYEFLNVVHNRAQVKLWQRRGARYFPLIESKLKKAGLPNDLKYLAVAESDLRPSALSPSNALGLWQFIPSTARAFNLTVTNSIDERHLPEPLLDIGLTFLNKLYNQFGSWPLAMAGYNCGENCVSRRLKTQNINDYYNLTLPRETERYIYRIAAIKIVLENPQAYGFSEGFPDSWRKNTPYEEVIAQFPQATTWPYLVQLLNTDYKTIRSLNPHILQTSIKGNNIRFRVPLGAGKKVLQTQKNK